MVGQALAEQGLHHLARAGAALGVPLDAELRALLVSTIIETNGASVVEGRAIEADRADRSLAMSSAKIGVQAMLRGKPPQFEHPLS